MKHVKRIVFCICAVALTLALLAGVGAAGNRTYAEDAESFVSALESGSNFVRVRGTFAYSGDFDADGRTIEVEYGCTLTLTGRVTSRLVVFNGGKVTVADGGAWYAPHEVEVQTGGTLEIASGGLLRTLGDGCLRLRPGASFTIDGTFAFDPDDADYGWCWPRCEINDGALLSGNGEMLMSSSKEWLCEDALDAIDSALSSTGISFVEGWPVSSAAELDGYLAPGGNPYNIWCFRAVSDMTLSGEYGCALIASQGTTVSVASGARLTSLFVDGEATVSGTVSLLNVRTGGEATVASDGEVDRLFDNNGKTTLNAGASVYAGRGSHFANSGELTAEAGSSITVADGAELILSGMDGKVTLGGALVVEEGGSVETDGSRPTILPGASVSIRTREDIPVVYQNEDLLVLVLSGEGVLTSFPYAAIEDGSPVFYPPEVSCKGKSLSFWDAWLDGVNCGEKGKACLLPEKGFIILFPIFESDPHANTDLNEDEKTDVLDVILEVSAVAKGLADEKYDIDGSGRTDAEDILCLIDSVVNDPKGHDWSFGVTEKPATCTETGLRRFVCLDCGAERVEILTLAPHEWDEGHVTREPADGVDGEMTYTCAVCGQTRKESISYLPIRVGLDGFNDLNAALEEASRRSDSRNGRVYSAPVEVYGQIVHTGDLTIGTGESVIVMPGASLEVKGRLSLGRSTGEGEYDFEDSGVLRAEKGAALTVGGVKIAGEGGLFAMKDAVEDYTDEGSVEFRGNYKNARAEDGYVFCVNGGVDLVASPDSDPYLAAVLIGTEPTGCTVLTVKTDASLLQDVLCFGGVEIEKGVTLTVPEGIYAEMHWGEIRGKVVDEGTVVLGSEYGAETTVTLRGTLDVKETGEAFSRDLNIAPEGRVENRGFFKNELFLNIEGEIENTSSYVDGKGFLPGQIVFNGWVDSGDDARIRSTGPEASLLFDGSYQGSAEIEILYGSVETRSNSYFVRTSVLIEEGALWLNTGDDLEFYGVTFTNRGDFVNEGRCRFVSAAPRDVVKYDASIGFEAELDREHAEGSIPTSVYNYGRMINGQEGCEMWEFGLDFEGESFLNAEGAVFDNYGEANFRARPIGTDIILVPCDAQGNRVEGYATGMYEDGGFVSAVFLTNESDWNNRGRMFFEGFDESDGSRKMTFTNKGTLAWLAEGDWYGVEIVFEGEGAKIVGFEDTEIRLNGCKADLTILNFPYAGGLRINSEFYSDGAPASYPQNRISEVVCEAAVYESVRDVYSEAIVYSTGGFYAAKADREGGTAYDGLRIRGDVFLSENTVFDGFEQYFVSTYWDEENQRETGAILTLGGGATYTVANGVNVSIEDNEGWQTGSTLILEGRLVLSPEIPEERDEFGNIVTEWVEPAQLRVCPYASFINQGTIETSDMVIIQWRENEKGEIIHPGECVGLDDARHEAEVFTESGLRSAASRNMKTIRLSGDVTLSGDLILPSTLDSMEIDGSSFVIPAGVTLLVGSGYPYDRCRFACNNFTLTVYGTLAVDAKCEFSAFGGSIRVENGGTLHLYGRYFGDANVRVAPGGTIVFHENAECDAFGPFEIYGNAVLDCPRMIAGVAFASDLSLSGPSSQNDPYVEFRDCSFGGDLSVSVAPLYPFGVGFCDSAVFSEGKKLIVRSTDPIHAKGARHIRIEGAAGIEIDTTVSVFAWSRPGTSFLLNGVLVEETGDTEGDDCWGNLCWVYDCAAEHDESFDWEAGNHTACPANYGYTFFDADTGNRGGLKLSGTTLRDLNVRGNVDCSELILEGDAAIHLDAPDRNAVVHIGTNKAFIHREAPHEYIVTAFSGAEIVVEVTDLSFGFTLIDPSDGTVPEGRRYISSHIFGSSTVFCSLNVQAVYEFWDNGRDHLPLTDFAVYRVNENNGTNNPTKTHISGVGTKQYWIDPNSNGNIEMRFTRNGISVDFVRLPIKPDDGWSPDFQ